MTNSDGDVEDGRAIHRRSKKGGSRHANGHHNSPSPNSHSPTHHNHHHHGNTSDTCSDTTTSTLNSSEKMPLMRSDSWSDSNSSDSHDGLSLPTANAGTNHHHHLKSCGSSSSSAAAAAAALSPHQRVFRSTWLRWSVLAILLAQFMYYLPAMYLSMVYYPARGRMFYGHLDDLVFKPTFHYEAVQEAAAETANSVNNNGEPSVHIPRIVHVTYKSREELPEEWKYSLKQWQAMNPHWEVRFWSDQDIADFVHDQYPEMEAMHQSYKYVIQRVDSVRYMILHHFGGVYSDMDIYPATSLDKLLEQWEEGNKNVLLAETFNMGTTNAFMAAAPQSNFMKCVIENLPNYQTMRVNHILQWQHWEVLSSAGPTFLWGMVGHCQDDQLQILAKETFRGCSTCDAWGRGNLAPTPCDTEWFHHSSTNSSWHQHRSLVHAFFFNVAMSFFCQPARGCAVFSVVTLSLVKYCLFRRNKKSSAKA